MESDGVEALNVNCKKKEKNFELESSIESLALQRRRSFERTNMHPTKDGVNGVRSIAQLCVCGCI